MPVSLSIKRVTLGFTVLLSAIVVTMVALDLRGLVQEWRKTAEVQRATVTLATLNKAVIELSLERSLLQATLSLPGPIPERFRAMVEAQRGASDALFADVERRLSVRTGTPQIQGVQDALKHHRGKIDALRADADANLAKPFAARDAAFMARLPEAMPATIEAMARLGERLRDGQGALPAQVVAQERVQRLAWAIREYSGRDRTYQAIALANDRPFAPAEEAAMGRMWAKADAAWGELQALAASRDLAPELAQAVSVLAAGHYGDYAALRDEMLAASRAGAPYPIDFESFFAVSTEALDEAVALSYAAGDANVAFWDGHADAQVFGIVRDAVALVLVVALAGAFLWYVARRVTGPIGGLTQAIGAIAEGRDDVALERWEGRDEIGRMTEAVRVFRDHQAEIERLRARQAETEAEAAATRRAEMQRLADSFERQVTGIVEELAEAVGAAERQAQALAHSAAESRNRAAEVSARNREATDSLAGMASASDSLSDSVGEISQQVAAAARGADTAQARSSATDATVRELSETVRDIGTVVSLIRDIAEQTNLLALNATIEAARAGDAGKGFAVVASEVKTLATQTGKATEEIAQRIGAVERIAGDAVSAIGEIRAAIADVDALSRSVAEAVGGQDTATRDIASRAQAVSAGATESREAVGALESLATAAGDSAGSLAEAMAGLSARSDRLRSEVDGFLSHVRAA